jgi:hypothetical protein
LGVFASISPLLPLLNHFLSSLVVLEEKAAELYHFSLLEKSVSPHRTKRILLGVEKYGEALRELHDHLLNQGFQQRSKKPDLSKELMPFYFREDLGILKFICPQVKPNQKPTLRGLAAMPNKSVSFLLENTHSVEISYLGNNYEVQIPQVGRFILEKGLGLKTGRHLNSNRIFESAWNLLIILDLLVLCEELQEEALNDFLEIRPPGLVVDFLENLRQNGPGSVVWDSAQKLYLERYPGSKIVSLTTWYWKFLPYASRFLEKQKDLSM